MANWGYTINKDNQIDFDKNSRSIMDKLIATEPSFAACISCGSCSATCSAGSFTTLSFRKLIIQITRGETEGIKNDIKKCLLCGKCMLVCPRGVNTRNILLELKKLMN